MVQPTKKVLKVKHINDYNGKKYAICEEDGGYSYLEYPIPEPGHGAIPEIGGTVEVRIFPSTASFKPEQYEM